MSQNTWSRRRFLKAAGLLPFANSLGCKFEYLESAAVASTFETTSTSSLLWFHSVCHSRLGVRLTRLDGSETREATVELGRGNVGQLDVDSLLPGTEYRYTIDEAPEAGAYTFRTLPDPTIPASVRLGFSGCYDPHPRFKSGIMDTLAEASLDAFFGLGDFPYCDDPPAPIGIDGFRWRHELARYQPTLQKLMRSTSICAMYDDHELGDGWDSDAVEELQSFSSAGLKAWLEWFPQRTFPVYKSTRIGRNVHVFLLDTRLYREPLTGESPSMLGSEQEQWLEAEMTSSDAPFKIVAMPAPLNSQGQDDWSHYLVARDRLLATFQRAAGQVCVLSSDAHFFAARLFPEDLWEFQVGPLARTIASFRPEVPEDILRVFKTNAGIIEVSAGESPSLVFRAVGPEGEVLYEQTLQA